MKTLTIVTLALLWGATATAAEVKAEYDKQADFTRYKTWTWRHGTPAPNLAADKHLREAIESQLAARNLTKVQSGGDLEVVYHAAAESRISLENLGYKEPGFETEAKRIRYLRAGTVLLDVIDASTGKVVWRGQVADATDPGPHAIDRMIDDGIGKLFDLFPTAAILRR